MPRSIKLSDLTLRARLALGFGVIVLVIMASTAVSFVVAGRVSGSATELENTSLPMVIMADNMVLDVLRFRAGVFESALNEDASADELARQLNEVETGIRTFKELYAKREDTDSLAALERMEADLKAIGESGERLILARLAFANAAATMPARKVSTVVLKKAYLSTKRRTVVQEKHVKKSVYRTLLEEVQDAQTEFDRVCEAFFTAIDNLKTAMASEASSGINEVQRASAFMLRAVTAAGISALLLSVLVGGIISRSVVTPVGRTVDLVYRVARGDLGVDIGREGKSELGRLLEAVGEMVTSLRATVLRIEGLSGSLEERSQALSQTTSDLNADTSEQARQTAQISAAMEQMSKSVIEVAESAVTAASSSQKASEVATKGRESVQKAVDGMHRIAQTVMDSSSTMGELGKSGQAIGEIVSVINDIADQTNLLALNAAIEAARAGDQGRGFAVVADEVRKLAERTSRATDEIAGMITRIQSDTSRAVEGMDTGKREVEDGLTLAEEAMVALEEIVKTSQSTAQMIEMIATAAEEQSATADHVAENMEGISKITSRTENYSEKLNSAAGELSSLARELTEAMEWFKVGGGGTQESQ
jgi:methyl-accepting chemotaxis protein